MNPTGQSFDVVLDRLRSPSLFLVLDNFETFWEPPHTHADTETLLRTLSALKTVTIIITARGSRHPSGIEWTQLLPPLKPVRLESAVAIFHAISRKNDDYVIKLVRAVDCVSRCWEILLLLKGKQLKDCLGCWGQILKPTDAIRGSAGEIQFCGSTSY